jgi:hypothetical protein
MTLSFGNDNSSSIGGKIIQDCKTIRIINKEIDKMIKQEKKEKEKQDKEKRKQDKKTRRNKYKRNFISNLAKNNSNIQKENNVKQMITLLLSKYRNKLENKTLTNLERKETLEIIQKLKAYKNSNL